ncbi:MAG: AraC family transcriptional regulator [Clostridiales bacterium]|nr:AraC family transcriptional regulator [Clostridiales bacterium]
MEIVSLGYSKESYTHFPEHQHGFWEILFNVSGEGSFSAAGEEYPFSPGAIAVIPPYVPHSKDSPEGFTDRSVFIKNFRNIGGPGVKVFRDDERGSVRQIFDMTEYFYGTKTGADSGTSAAILSVLGDLLYQVLVSYYIRSKSRDIRLEGVVELMHKNIPNHDFDLSEAIRRSGYSMGYFRKIFKEMTGQSPVAYLHFLRINHAKSLFQQYGPSRTVKEIAWQCGFEDPLYFSRIFKQSEGISPQEYIRSLEAEPSPDDYRMIAMDTPSELL